MSVHPPTGHLFIQWQNFVCTCRQRRLLSSSCMIKSFDSKGYIEFPPKYRIVAVKNLVWNFNPFVNFWKSLSCLVQHVFTFYDGHLSYLAPNWTHLDSYREQIFTLTVDKYWLLLWTNIDTDCGKIWILTVDKYWFWLWTNLDFDYATILILIMDKYGFWLWTNLDYDLGQILNLTVDKSWLWL